MARTGKQVHGRWKAWLLLVLLSAMQMAVLTRGLHRHESACSFSAELTEQGVWHPHTDEDHSCAWAGVHFSAFAASLSAPLYFFSLHTSSGYANLPVMAPHLPAISSSGRAPPFFS